MRREKRGENDRVVGGGAIGTQDRCEKGAEDVVVGEIWEAWLWWTKDLTCEEVDLRRCCKIERCMCIS